MFMGLVSLLPLVLLIAVGGWVAAVAMLKKGRSPLRLLVWLSIPFAIAIAARLLFECMFRGGCQYLAGVLGEFVLRMTVIAAHASLLLIPLLGGLLAGLAGGWLFWRMTHGQRPGT